MFKSQKIEEEEKLEQDVIIGDLKLPPRQKNAQTIKPLRTEEIRTNCYKITFKPDARIYRYEAKFYVETSRTTKELSEGVKTDVGNEQRRNCLWKLFMKVVLSNKQLFNDPMKIVYDCGCQLISVDKLPLTEELQKIDIDPEQLDSKNERLYLPKEIKQLYVVIKYLEEIKLDSASLSQNHFDKRDRSALSLLELVYNQKVISSNKFDCFPQKSFLKSGDEQHVMGRIFKDGFAKTVCPCDDREAGVGLMLQSDVGKSAFFPNMKLMDYLYERFGCRSQRDLEDLGSRKNAKKLSNELKKLTLKTTHLTKNRIFVCDGLTEEALKNVSFNKNVLDEDGQVIKKKRCYVQEYFEDRFQQRLNDCSQLPCVIQTARFNGEKQKNFYPMSVLEIVGGQRVPVQKMESQFQNILIKNSRMNPEEAEHVAKNVMKTAHLDQTNPYARKFQCPLNSTPMTAQAEILAPPAIAYAGNVIEQPQHDGRLQWNPPENRKYLINGRVDKWLVVNYNRCVKDDRVLNGFLDQFTRLLKTRGTYMGKHEIMVESRDDRIKDYACNEGFQFVLAITWDKMDPLHDSLKHFEMVTGIITQHICQMTLSNVVNKGQKKTLENICLKTNEKLGGTNFTVTLSNAFLNNNPSMRGLLERNLVGGNQFIGIDLSHDTPGSVSSLPSVVGMAYTFNNDMSMTGFYFFTEARRHIISVLGKYLQKPITDYKARSENKQWPKHLFIYRSGVSEGEYMYLTGVEKRAINECLDQLQSQYPDFVRPGFTFIIGQRTHGKRMAPLNPPQQRHPNQRISDADRNVKPGTCVSNGITDPAVDQFLLASHITIQGYCRPILYTVVAEETRDGKRIPIDQLKTMTYFLAHLHGGVMGTVNSPHVLYHAAAISNRGQKNLKFDTFGTTDDIASTHSNSKNTPNSPSVDELAQLTDKLMIKATGKYWC